MAPSQTPDRGQRVVRLLPFAGNDEALLEALHQGHAHATAELVARYSEHVLRVLVRILGRCHEVEDLHHDVFVRALSSVSSIHSSAALKGWITIVTVNVARSAIARRRRSRWLWFLPPEEVPEVEAPALADEDGEALRAAYRVLDRLGADLRIVFALRLIDGMEMADVAAACGVSLATAKRRVSAAERRFLTLARLEPAVLPWIEAGIRWRDK